MQPDENFCCAFRLFLERVNSLLLNPATIPDTLARDHKWILITVAQLSIMNPHPTALKPTDIIATAVKHIMKYRCRNLPVADEQGRYLGIFGVNCLLRSVLPKAAVIDQGVDSVPFIQDTLSDLDNRLREVENQPVSMCMSTDIATVAPETPLVETLLVLHRTRTSIPVVDEDSGKLAGMISYWDAGERILSA